MIDRRILLGGLATLPFLSSAACAAPSREPAQPSAALHTVAIPGAGEQGMKLFLAVAAALGSALLLSAPAAAQALSSVDQNGIRRMIVYGTDACPPSAADEVVICARRPDRDRYRVPERFREPDELTGEHESWAYRAEQLEMVGAGGTMSCSPVGPGGATGCLQQLITQSRAERRQKTTDEKAFPAE